MADLATSILEVVDQKILDSKTPIVFAGTVSTVTPPTAVLDGSSVSVPVKAATDVPLEAGRRVAVIAVGSDLVAFLKFGSYVDPAPLPPPMVFEYTESSGTATFGNSVFATASTGASAGGSFIVPTSGNYDVEVFAQHMTTDQAAQRAVVGFAIRAGLVVGSGTVQLAASTNRSFSFSGTTIGSGVVKWPVLGDTPGAERNVRLEGRIPVGVMSIIGQRIVITPR